MIVSFSTVRQVFIRSVPPDCIPQEAYDRVHRMKSALQKKFQEIDSPELFDELSVHAVVIAADQLIRMLSEEWDAEHPSEAAIIARLWQMREDHYALQTTEETVDEDGERGDRLIEAEEPGLLERYYTVLIRRDFGTAKRMRDFLIQNEVEVPSEINTYIEQRSHPGLNKEKRE